MTHVLNQQYFDKNLNESVLPRALCVPGVRSKPFVKRVTCIFSRDFLSTKAYLHSHTPFIRIQSLDSLQLERF